MASQGLFFIMVAAVAAQRSIELAHSRRNTEALLARGGREHARWQLKWMVLLHAGWLVGMTLEVLLLSRPFSWAIAAPALAVFAAGQALRYATIRALGPRWTTRIITVPGEHLVTGGIFKYLRHPNYLGVCLELVALPMVHCAWLTAIVATVLNGWMLTLRIDAEEAALARDSHHDELIGSH